MTLPKTEKWKEWEAWERWGLTPPEVPPVEEEVPPKVPPEVPPEIPPIEPVGVPPLDLPSILERVYPELFEPTPDVTPEELPNVVFETIQSWVDYDPEGFMVDLFERDVSVEDTRTLLTQMGVSEEYTESVISQISFIKAEEAFSKVFPTVENVDQALRWVSESEENWDEFLELVRRIGRNEDTENLLRALTVEATEEQISYAFGEVPGLPPGMRITSEGMEFVIELEGVRKLALLKPDATVWMGGKHVGTLNPDTGLIEPKRAWWEKALIGLEWAFAPFALFGQAMFGPAEREEILAREEELLGAEFLAEMEELRIFIQTPPPEVNLRTEEGKAEWLAYTDRLTKARTRLAELERIRAQTMARTTLPSGEAYIEYRQKPFWLQLLAELPMWIAAGGASATTIRAALALKVGIAPTAVRVTLYPLAQVERIIGYLPSKALQKIAKIKWTRQQATQWATLDAQAQKIMVEELEIILKEFPQLAVRATPETLARIAYGMEQILRATPARVRPIDVIGQFASEQLGREASRKIARTYAKFVLEWASPVKPKFAIEALTKVGFSKQTIAKMSIETAEKHLIEALGQKGAMIALLKAYLPTDVEIIGLVEKMPEVAIPEAVPEVIPPVKPEVFMTEEMWDKLSVQARAKAAAEAGLSRKVGERVWEELTLSEKKALGFEEIPPAVVKPPAIPEERVIYTEKGIPVPPEETIPPNVVREIPMVQDIGVLERVRPTRKVFERMGIGEIHKGIQRAEVELGEARVAFNKQLKEVSKLVDKDRRYLVFRELENPKSVVGLTFNEKRAVNFFRENFKKWADTLNLSEEKRLKNYITHIFEADITQVLKAKHPLDPAIARAFEYKVPKTIFNPFLQKRLGATTGLIEDPFAAASAYEASQLKVLYYEPFIQKIAAIANDINTPRAARAYLKDFSRRMTGEPSKLDLEINTTLQEFAQKLGVLPGGEALASYLSRGNPSGLAAYNFTSTIYTLWLGFKATSALRNLSQHTLIIGEVGPIYFAEGIGLRFTEEGKAALRESLVLRSRKAAFIPGIDDSFAEQWIDKFREVALYMFRLADKQNVSDAFLAGYAEAKALMPEAGREWWIKRGDEVAADTQYLYTKMNSMAISQSSIGRVFSILTTWSENWMELMVKWVSRKPSQVYLEYEKLTGTKLPKKNWSQSYKAILMYMAIIGLGYAIKEQTRLKAWEYTGLTSIRYLADIVGGDFPGLQAPGAVGKLIGGFLTDDERMMKEGWNQLRRTLTPGILKQLENVILGEKDWLTLFFYLEGQDYKIKQLKNTWEKGWKEYPVLEDAEERMAYLKKHPEHIGWSDAKIRNQWREDNPTKEAEMFITGKFTTLSTDKARAEVLRLIEKHDLNTELIDGYEKVFGVDTDEELTKSKNRIGNLEKFVVGEEAEYFTVGNYVSEINKMVKTQGRAKVQRDGNPFTVAILEALDLFVQYDSLEEADARKLYRQQFPDVEAWMYLMGRVQSFENPKSAEILLGLMEKYDIPPEGIRAFLEDPSRYDELFTQKFELQKRWFDLNTEYENYGNIESPLYIEDDELRKEAREKLKEDNPNWVADMRRIEAIDNDASPEIIDKWAERGKTIDEHGAGSSEAKVWLIDNPETFKWALDNELLTDDGSDWNVPVLRINAKWRVEDEAYNALETPPERQEYLLKHKDYRMDRRRREAFGDGFAEEQIENFVNYWELPVGGFRQERFLLDNPEFADAMHTIKGIDLPKPQDVPSVRYDEIYEKWQTDFDKLDGLSDHKSEFYIEDPDKREKARDAMRFDKGKLTEFGKAEIRRNAYKNFVPEEYVKNYVGYYTIISEGKPDDWKKKKGTDLYYEDDWFMMEHMDFYREVYLKILGNERLDFRTVPTRKVFDKYLVYLRLPKGKRRDDYRWFNPQLDAWLVLKFGYTPIVEKKRREELTPTEEFLDELKEREEEFDKAMEELEKSLEELTD